MPVSKLELKCWEYVQAIQDIEKFVGKGIYGLDNNRKRIHDEICDLSGLPKEETQKVTDHLDRVDYNGTNMYLKLLRMMREKQEAPND